MKRLLPYGLLAVLALLVGLFARTAPARMPQALAGGDFLSVLLGDAKRDISGAMVREADSYFHGGVDMDCHHLHGHHDHDLEAPHEHHADEEHDHEEEESFDPWRWINAHVRAPDIDRHLAGDEAVELMPWFWVAIKSDPHNVEAWSAAWYVASHMMKDDALALRIATEGWRLNPESLELACVLGRSYRAEGSRDLDKVEKMFRMVVELAEKTKDLPDNDYQAFFYAVGYLADSAKRRKDVATLAKLLNMARRVNPNHPTTRFISQTLKELETASLSSQVSGQVCSLSQLALGGALSRHS